MDSMPIHSNTQRVYQVSSAQALNNLGKLTSRQVLLWYFTEFATRNSWVAFTSNAWSMHRMVNTFSCLDVIH